MRIVSPWRRPVLLGGVVLLGVIAAQGTGQLIFARFAYVLGALLLGSLCWSVMGVIGVRIERVLLTQRVVVGDTIRERISVYNTLPWTRPLVEVIDDSALPDRMPGFIVDIPARQQRQRSWHTRAGLRGSYVMGPTIVIGSDPFGLFRVERVFVGHQVLWVHPCAEHVPIPQIGRTTDIGHRTVGRQLTVHSPLVVSVRDYRAGDALSRVHWRSTARRGQLMIKESIDEPGASFWVVLDAHVLAHEWRDALGNTQALDSTEEAAVQVAASLVQSCIQAGQDVGLVAYGSQEHSIVPQHSHEQQMTIFDALAQVRCIGNIALEHVLTTVDFKATQRPSLLVVTSDTTPQWVNVLQQHQRLGLGVWVVLIDPISFAGGRDTQQVEQALLDANIRYVCIRRGQTLATAM